MITREEYRGAILEGFLDRLANAQTVTCELCNQPAKVRYHYFAVVGKDRKGKPKHQHKWVCEDCKENQRAEVAHVDYG